MQKIAFTTSRDPAKKTRSFIKDIMSVVPQSSRHTRGSARLNYTLNILKNQGVKIAIIIDSIKGNPNFWHIYDLSNEIPVEIPFAIKVRGLTLSREYTDKKNSQPSHSIFISSLDNEAENNVIKQILNIQEIDSSSLEKKAYVTAYADYIDKDEKLIFIEFTDNFNNSVGPRMKIKVIPRRVDENMNNSDN